MEPATASRCRSQFRRYSEVENALAHTIRKKELACFRPSAYMDCYIGIDIGAVSVNAALLVSSNRAGEAELPAALQHLTRTAGGDIYLVQSRRTRGSPLDSAIETLRQIIEAVGPDNIRTVCLTGSGSTLAAARLGCQTVNEFKAIAIGASATGLKVRTIFEMGGESSKYLRLEPNEDGSYGIIDYATNGDCAAGTGSFIDQQAGRLKFAVEDVGQICLDADRAAQVAGRCSVFAKSDMIHAQQKGYSPSEVLRGLCNAVARNFRTAVVRSHPVEPPVAFIGGVAHNSAVNRAMREAFDLDESQMIIPEAFSHLPAIGAAVTASNQQSQFDLSSIEEISTDARADKQAPSTMAPLSMENVILLRDRVEPVEPEAWAEKIEAYLGLDIGSVSTNLVILDIEGNLIHEIYTRTQGRPIEVVCDALDQIRQRWQGKLVIRGVGTTGSGRELIGQLVGADTINDEITAHKTGATYIGTKMLGGRIPDTIFEIGGQDSKFISLQDGVVVDFTMNEACAAGTGSFLEERAEELDIAIIDEFAELALSSETPLRLGERCTVFMERDVNSHMQQGAAKADIVAGLAYSVVQNYINRVVRGRKIGETIFFQGGTAYNDAVAAAFASVCGKEIIVPPHNGVIGAIGAALLAKDKMAANGQGQASQPDLAVTAGELGTYVSNKAQSTFRGYDLASINYTLREFSCKGCSNTCQIQEFDVQGEKTYWGDKCSDRFRKRVKSANKPVIDDLFDLRQQFLMDETGLADLPANAPTVGIPLTMFALEQLPFWRMFLNRCGYRVVLSDPTNHKIIQAGLDTVVAEPCFPIIVAHGHIANLLEADKTDHILLPNILSMETKWMNNESHLCPWHQTLPYVVRNAPAFYPDRSRFFEPLIRFREGRKTVTQDLQQYFRRWKIPKRTVAKAAARAFEAQDNFRIKLLAAGEKALSQLERKDTPGIVIVGRPYNVHDVGVNLSVARKLRDYYGVNCIPLDFLDTADVDIRDINSNMYWDLGRRIIAAAKLVGRRPNLEIIYITNFKCGPDSFIKHFIRNASGKPFLSLQFDGHSNDAGVMTRCEAYLDSKGILRPWRAGETAEIRV